MQIQKVDSSKDRSEICEHILRALPDWFAIEEAIQQYVASVANMEFLAAYEGDARLLGFLAMNYHFDINAEIHVMGVLPDAHGLGVGRNLVDAAQALAKQKSAKFLSVKTLSPAREDVFYGKTRKFYESLGFLKFEEIPNLWGPENPCLVMVLPL